MFDLLKSDIDFDNTENLGQMNWPTDSKGPLKDHHWINNKPFQMLLFSSVLIDLVIINLTM